MAKYHTTLEYHKDEKEKHPLTDDDISFLLELQKEMNTQDNCGTASPRYWGIVGTNREYGVDSGYADDWGIKLDFETIVNSEDLLDYIKSYLVDNADDFDEFEYELEDSWLSITKGGMPFEYNIEDSDDVLDLFERFFDFESYDLEILYYKDVAIVYKNLMFLTQKDAENHLRSNHYHYSEDAHTYCMHGWRSPRFERLIKILQETDFDGMLKKGENNGIT